MELSKQAVEWLLAAGRIIQSRHQGNPYRKRIEVKPGEKYPEAVIRVLAQMDGDDQIRLYELVDFAVETDKGFNFDPD